MSFWRKFYHLTWATKNRLPLIQAEFEGQLYSYMVRKAAELDIFVYAINGTENHIHVVAAISPNQSVAGAVKHIKGASSHYVNHVMRPDEHFNWQRGYGCLTVGEKQRPIAENCVRSQKEHHAEQKTNDRLERFAEEDEGPTDNEAHAEIVIQMPPTKNIAGG